MTTANHNFGASITVDNSQAVQSLGEVQRVTGQTSQAMTNMGQAGEQSAHRAGQAVADLTAKERTLTTTTREAGAAQTAAGNASAGFAQQAIALGSRIASTGMAIQGMIGQLGVSSHTAGLIGSITQASVAGAQLGLALGPGGALVGGILGAAIPALTSLIQHQNDAATAAREHRTQLEQLADTTLAGRRAESRQRDISEGVFGSDTTGDQLTHEREVRRLQIEDLDESVDRQIAAQQEYANTVHARGETFERLQARLQEGIADERAQIAQLRQEVENIDTEIERRSTRHRQTSDRTLITTEGTPPTTAHSAGAPEPVFEFDVDAQNDSDQNSRERAEMATELAVRAGDTLRQSYQEAENYRQRMLEASAEAATQEADALISLAEREREANEASQALSQQRIDAQRLLTDSVNEAGEAFFSQVGSVDAVIDAFQRYNEAADLAGSKSLSTGQLMEQSMRSVASQAGTSLVKGLGGALAASVSAAVHGAQSFEVAMARMTEALLDNIMQEAIIQGILELAKAISDFASQNYAGGAAHLAAMAAWAVVGVAAGGGAAAIRSTDAYAAGAGGGTTAPTAGASAGAGPSQSEEATRRDITIIYNGNIYETRQESVRAIQSLMRDAESDY